MALLPAPRQDNLTFVRDTFWKVMFAAEKSRLELFSSQIDNDIERKLFQSTLLMMDSTKTLKDVPTSLEFICQTWQELACVRECVVSQSQTRTPMDIALNIIATVPSLCSGSGDKDEMWKKMLDPASGSGLLIALAMHRAMLESNVLAGGMMVMGGKERGKEEEMEMEMEMHMDANKEENKDADDTTERLATTSSIRSHKKRETAAEERRDAKHCAAVGLGRGFAEFECDDVEITSLGGSTVAMVSSTISETVEKQQEMTMPSLGDLSFGDMSSDSETYDDDE